MKARGKDKGLLSAVMMIYLFCLLVVMPLYVRNGYEDIGQAKYQFFLVCSLVGLPLGALCQVFAWITKGKKVVRRQGIPRLSITHCLFGYLLCQGISLFWAKDMGVALWGVDGWYMGYVTQLMLVFLFYLVSRCRFPVWWKLPAPLWMGLLGSLPVYLLAICHRFFGNPMATTGIPDHFLSTMGNVNWYCGYWAIFSSLGVGAFLMMEEKLPSLFLGGYCGIAMLTGLTQGSDSAYLVFGVWFLGILWLAFSGRRYLEKGLCLLCMFGLASWMVDHFWWGLILFVLCLLLSRLPFGEPKVLRCYVFAVVVGVMVTLLVLWVVNSKVPGGIWPVNQSPWFFFSDLWGNGRGGIWKNTWMAFLQLRGRRLLLGVGPDGYAGYLESLPELERRITEQFGSLQVTNAHHEWLTELINGGILGSLCYVAGFVLAILRGCKLGKRKPEMIPFILGIFAYVVHQFVSFRQILSAPYIFMVLGLVEGLTNLDDSHTISGK